MTGVSGAAGINDVNGVNENGGGRISYLHHEATWITQRQTQIKANY